LTGFTGIEPSENPVNLVNLVKKTKTSSLPKCQFATKKLFLTKTGSEQRFGFPILRYFAPSNSDNTFFA
jgi:hypothetical protein